MNRFKTMLMSFPASFRFDGMSDSAPAGMYEITIEEELIGDTVYPVYHRISTSIYIPLPEGRAGIGQIHYISADALARQQATLSLVI